MSLLSLARKVIDPRNLSIGADVGGHIRDVLADGKVGPREVVDAAHGAIEHALSEYGAADTVVARESIDQSDVRARIEVALDRIFETLNEALADRQITYGELNDVSLAVARAVLDVVAPLEPQA